MLVLAADTSTDCLSVALCRDDVPLAECHVAGRRRHSERLLATVDWLLTEARVGWRDIDLLAVSIGPGSFTGLRIGVAAWKGLALARELPLMGAPTLDAMSRVGALAGGLVCPMIDARMGEVFWAAYRYADGVRASVVAPQAGAATIALDALTDPAPLFLGDGANLYRDEITARMPGARFAPPAWAAPRAAAVAAEALDRLAAGENADPALAAPIYLRQSQPEELRARRAAAAP